MRIKPFPQKCVIVNEKYSVERNKSNVGMTGYKIFNEKQELIGVVALDPKYDGRAVIRFLNEIKASYGVWHLIQNNYTFSHIETRLLKEDKIEITVE